MARKQMNIRLDDLTRATIKRLAEQHNMSESQVITRAVILLDEELKESKSDVNKPKIAHNIAPDDDLSTEKDAAPATDTASQRSGADRT